ncbi:hypothetical protein GCM10010327_49940 [Streptomyces nitrosporeus]|nr:hypothetical protein GCM10010327_49940 [Streptomyces nitrosporeus]
MRPEGHRVFGARTADDPRQGVLLEGCAHEMRRRRVQALISRKGSPNIKGLGKLR